ncbi:helix-turn-helix domain-containing protein [Sphingomonas aliaeris]|uniref:Helix-turn-helix domain-containing protein n=1 Tax=Sphingomonas aliaeris TaxID=2759526 RepID=A0A974S3J7_9SPHN|nr:helix-turn-helix domain-containing protein [Sphingomonas aliaeris]QQV76602.1 helix-turn-helix domain-containing protein [Sphingomonas aliaeris]
MTDVTPAEDAKLFPKTAGERLREAREAQGLSLAEVAARTRVPVRHLEAIETDSFATMPSVTYAVGFAKAYARAVGLNEVEIAREVRGQDKIGVRRTEYEQYEIDEPSRTPSLGLAVVAGIVVAALLIAVGLWYGTNLFNGESSPPAAAIDNAEIMPAPTPSSAAPATTAAVPTSGQVVLTATDEVWMRVYDAANKTLFLGTLKPGEKFDVPSDANGPMINVGRPDKLQVTLNGSVLPPLGTGRVAIKDVPIGAAALGARANGAPAAAATAPAATAPANSTTNAPPAFRDTSTTDRSTRSAPRQPTPQPTRPSQAAPAPAAPAPAATSAPDTTP